MQVPAEVQLDVWMRLMAHGHASAELVQLVAALAQTHMRAFVASLLAHAGSLQHHMRDVIRMLRPLARGSADVPDADLHKSALEDCEKIATRSRPGIAEMKRLAREGADLGIDQQMRLERDAAVRALPSDDVAEGLDAFENRRAPEFKA